MLFLKCSAIDKYNDMDVFPEISTSRLFLRKITFNDLPLIVKYANNINIANNVLNVPHPYREEDAIAWMNFAYQGYKHGERFVFAIEQKESEAFIGGIGLHIDSSANKAELGYWIGEPFWNNGFISEAVSAVLSFGFEKLFLNKIFATHFLDNLASGKVLKNNGMILEAELKDHCMINGKYKSVLQYKLTRHEYLNKS